jgi:hypothetical protein
VDLGTRLDGYRISQPHRNSIPEPPKPQRVDIPTALSRPPTCSLPQAKRKTKTVVTSVTSTLIVDNTDKYTNKMHYRR